MEAAEGKIVAGSRVEAGTTSGAVGAGTVSGAVGAPAATDVPTAPVIADPSRNPVADTPIARPAVSVIVPAYNARSNIGKCLDSILAQSFGDFELIVVDDGSHDDTPAVLQEYARAGKIRLITQENQGVSVARNRGIGQACGKYLLFVDADDIVKSDLLKKVFAKAEAHDAQMCIFAYYVFSPSTGLKQDMESCPEESLYEQAFSLADVSCLASEVTTPAVWRALFLREFLEDEGIRFQENLTYSEDLAFMYEALFKARRIVLLKDVLYGYRKDTAGSITKSGHTRENFTALLHLKAALGEILCDERLKRQFINLVLDQVRYSLSVSADSAEYRDISRTYREEWSASLVQDVGLVDASLRDFFDTISQSDELEYLFHLFAKEREEVEKLLNSRSYLAGRALAEPLSALKRVFGRGGRS